MKLRAVHSAFWGLWFCVHHNLQVVQFAMLFCATSSFQLKEPGKSPKPVINGA